jgi:hypothetical protein
MVRKAKTAKKARGAAKPAVMQPDDVEPAEILDRPDGYYWSSPDGDEAFGPYETYELAEAARDAVGDEAVAPSDALMEAEREIGIADWLDVETGEPAQGQSPPHFLED